MTYTIKLRGDQGEVHIRKIASLPEDMEAKPAERCAKGFIVGHSESGHHHVLTSGDVLERVDNRTPQGLKMLYAILEEPADLVQDAPTPHEGFRLDAGIYEFRIAREYDPFAEQARRVAD